MANNEYNALYKAPVELTSTDKELWLTEKLAHAMGERGPFAKYSYALLHCRY